MPRPLLAHPGGVGNRQLKDIFQRWIFKLRQGIKWHDGCDFKADDVLWNLSRSTNDKAPEFDPSQFAQARLYLGNFAGVQKIDDYTVAFDTKGPDSLFPL